MENAPTVAIVLVVLVVMCGGAFSIGVLLLNIYKDSRRDDERTSVVRRLHD